MTRHGWACRSQGRCRRSSPCAAPSATPARSPIAIDGDVQVARIERESRRPAARCRLPGPTAGRRAAEERQPVVEAMVEHQARIGCTVRPHVSGALGDDRHALLGFAGMPVCVEDVVRRRHERRLDHHRRPVRVAIHQQRRETRDVRARHRRAADLVEVQTAERRRSTRARMSWPGAITSGLSRSPPPARSGPRDENAAVCGAGASNTIVDGSIDRRGRTAVSPRTPSPPVRSMSDKCTVGIEWKSAFSEFGRRVHEHHADAARLLDRVGSCYARVDAAIAEHDLAGHLGRVEHRAAPPLSSGREARAPPQRDPRRADRRPSESMNGAGPIRASRTRRQDRLRRCRASPSPCRRGYACPLPPW